MNQQQHVQAGPTVNGGFSATGTAKAPTCRCCHRLVLPSEVGGILLAPVTGIVCARCTTWWLGPGKPPDAPSGFTGSEGSAAKTIR